MKDLIEIKTNNFTVNCDNVDCHYTVRYSVESMSKDFINKPCPDCGQNLLTQKDYDDYTNLIKTIRFINKWFSWLGIFTFMFKKEATEIKVHNGIQIKKT